jgi:hypothetical protein
MKRSKRQEEAEDRGDLSARDRVATDRRSSIAAHSLAPVGLRYPGLRSAEFRLQHR